MPCPPRCAVLLPPVASPTRFSLRPARPSMTDPPCAAGCVRSEHGQLDNDPPIGWRTTFSCLPPWILLAPRPLEVAIYGVHAHHATFSAARRPRGPHGGHRRARGLASRVRPGAGPAVAVRGGRLLLGPGRARPGPHQPAGRPSTAHRPTPASGAPTSRRMRMLPRRSRHTRVRHRRAVLGDSAPASATCRSTIRSDDRPLPPRLYVALTPAQARRASRARSHELRALRSAGGALGHARLPAPLLQPDLSDGGHVHRRGASATSVGSMAAGIRSPLLRRRPNCTTHASLPDALHAQVSSWRREMGPAR